MKKIVLIGLIFMSFNSCTSDDGIELNENNFLVFGHFYGECGGENCVETFKLTETSLYEDTNDNYVGIEFDFIKLGNDKFNAVKDLIDFFPNRLLATNETTFGCPDCADGGGIFVQYSENGTIRNWTIDQTKTNVPSYLHSFMDKVNEKIQLINN